MQGSKFLARVQNLMVIFMYAALALLVIYGIIRYAREAVSSAPFLPGGVEGLLSATALILSSVIAGLLYALIGFAATSVLPFHEIAGQNLGYYAYALSDHRGSDLVRVFSGKRGLPGCGSLCCGGYCGKYC